MPEFMRMFDRSVEPDEWHCPWCGERMPWPRNQRGTANVLASDKRRLFFCCPECKSLHNAEAAGERRTEPLYGDLLADGFAAQDVYAVED